MIQQQIKEGERQREGGRQKEGREEVKVKKQSFVTSPEIFLYT